MAPRYRRIAVIGAGPSGLAATHALAAKKAFDTIRVFERRDRVGGLWHYDPKPDVFPKTTGVPAGRKLSPPAKLPDFEPPAGEDPVARSALYWDLDSNVGADTMAFTHALFYRANSPASIKRLGHDNPSRPYASVTAWIEDLFKPLLSLVSLNTTVEKVEKRGNEWVLTLRKAKELYRGQEHDYWWTESFDAIVIASGHYTSKSLPDHFEHSKAYRKADKYVDKRVLVVGGNVSASDFINDLHAVVKGKLEAAIRGRNPALEAAYNLPNVQTHSTIKAISVRDKSTTVVTFDNGSSIEGLDYILFATGYRLQYPFLQPNPATAENRVAGFYEHVSNIDDSSLTLVGQVKAALSFRVFEYHAVAVARFCAGRNSLPLPSTEDQKKWELDRVREKGPASNFHAVAPDFEQYFNWLADFAGQPAVGTDAYALLRWDESWAENGFAILQLKGKYWQGIIDRNKAKL